MSVNSAIRFVTRDLTDSLANSLLIDMLIDRFMYIDNTCISVYFSTDISLDNMIDGDKQSAIARQTHGQICYPSKKTDKIAKSIL